ncbi:MAG: AI-2E family transporter [Candidatus Saccharimonadales bacterium]
MAQLFAKDDSDFEVTVSTHSIVRFIGLVLLTVLLFTMVRRSAHALTLIGIAFFLSIALNAPVRWLANTLPGKNKDKRTLATGLSMGVIIVLLLGFLIAIVPPLTRQTISFVKATPQLVDETKNGRGALGSFVERYKLQDDVEKLSNQLSSRVGNIGSSALSTVGKIGSSLFSLLTVLVLTIMMLTEGPRWRRLMEEMVPTKKRAHTNKLLQDMNKVVQGYVNGQVLLAAIAAVLIVPMFFIMNVSYPIALMVLVFICGLIPMVGHTIGAILCTLVALFTSIPAALVVLGYYILYQQIENYAVQPRIQANSTNMSPLIVFISVLVGGSFGGLLGALVSIPIAGCLRILLLDYLQRRDLLSRKTVKDIKTEGGEL